MARLTESTIEDATLNWFGGLVSRRMVVCKGPPNIPYQQTRAGDEGELHSPAWEFECDRQFLTLGHTTGVIMHHNK